ncbi:hypothetical protein Hanom_Chr17g01541791 [Helianthus anomalus]
MCECFLSFDLSFFVIFFMTRNDVPTTVTPGTVAKVDYSTAASSLALPDARKPTSTCPKARQWNNR